MNEAELTGWINIGRTGTFTDSSGRKHTFTDQDLEDIQTGYDPAKSEAALVFGHPKDSDPAFGWVHDLKTESGILSARFASVPDKVKELVRDKKYRYVSMSLSPDKKRLLHVGLLGAVAPAIDGLAPVSFKEADEGITINFSTNGDSMNPEELQQRIGALEAKLKEKDEEISALKAKLAETETGKGDAEKKAEETAAQFAAYKDGQAKAAREARVDSLIAAGKLEPAKREETLSFAAALGGIQTPVNFSAADGKTEAISAEEKHFRDLEAKQPDPRFVNFSLKAPLPGHAAAQTPAWSPSDMTSKM